MIRGYRDGDQAEWLRMRRTLWDYNTDDELLREMAAVLASGTDSVLFAERPDGTLCGFLEVALHAKSDGCNTSPVGYIEGWYVDADARRQGIGRALVAAAEDWARSMGCRQMGSDTEPWNEVSHLAHEAVGYQKTGRLMLFKKDLC